MIILIHSNKNLYNLLLLFLLKFLFLYQLFYLHKRKSSYLLYYHTFFYGAFPLYVDGVPSHLLRCLLKLEESFNKIKEKDIKVYALVNCGFYEGKQNKLAIEIIENWCEKCGLKWGQGLGIGAGPLLHSVKSGPAEHGPKKNLGKALNIISNNILNKISDNNLFITANFPRFAYKFAAEMGWKKSIKANKLRVKDLYIRK